MEAVLPSSPLSSAPSSHPPQPVTSSQQMSEWRPSRELPFEILQHVRIYFEESLFTRALDLLLSIVSSDVASQRRQITIPHADHIALAATLVVHPLVTTRTTSVEKWAEAIAALRLLRLLLKTVGPVNANFVGAFKFRKLYGARSNDEDEVAIKHSFANEDGIWDRTHDFWTVVGWALNCACLPQMYAVRWEHWQLWLEFMVDVLEADLKYNLSRDTPDMSMLWRYLSSSPGDTAHPRRVIRAIFADGSKSSLNEFREVFKKELKGPKQESDKIKKREAVNIEKEIYGDYLAQDESDSTTDDETTTSKRTSTRASSSRRITPRTSRQSLRTDTEDDTVLSSPTPTLGPPISIQLRLRLMQLLTHISSQLSLTQSRSAIFPDLSDLFTLFVEFIKPLPLSVFQQMTSPSICVTNAFSPAAYTTLLEFILQRLLENTSSTFDTIEPLSQDRLERHHLPYAANKTSIDANARVSLCLEGLLRSLANAGILRKTSTLVDAVEAGIARRLTKVKEKRERMKEESSEEEAWNWLNGSSVRMRSVVKRLKE